MQQKTRRAQHNGASQGRRSVVGQGVSVRNENELYLKAMQVLQLSQRLQPKKRRSSVNTYLWRVYVCCFGATTRDISLLLAGCRAGRQRDVILALMAASSALRLLAQC